MAGATDHSILIIIIVILLSLAYGFLLLASIAWLTARCWYLFATRRLRHPTGTRSWLLTAARESLRPSQPELDEELKTWAAKLYGTLFGLTFSGILIATQNSKTANDALEPLGLLAYPLLPTIGVLATVIEVLAISVAFAFVALKGLSGPGRNRAIG